MKMKHIAALALGATLFVTPAAATSYIATFNGVFGNGSAFSGKVTFDADKTFNGNN